MNILIVDDNEAWRKGLIRFLKLSGLGQALDLNFLEAETMAEALPLARQANITLLDLGLPDSDPEETLARIKDFEPPVIITSAWQDEKLKVRAMESGASSYFGKDELTGLCREIAEVRLTDMRKQALARQGEAA